jgi:3-phosphoshikimate 1-carboxyvinyltransferase
MLIAPSLDNGLVIELDGNITSRPYIDMTLSILNKLGIYAKFNDNTIIIKPKKDEIINTEYKVEADWSSASYFFSIVALSKNIELSFLNFRKDSFQGDINVCKYYELFGVKTTFQNGKLIIKKRNNFNYPEKIIIDLKDNPDLAQTIIVTAFGLNIPIKLTGLSTLKVKETDRIEALRNELTNLGASCIIDDESIEFFKSNKFNKNYIINTYDDHRMALAFAPLSVIFPIEIHDPKVVSKSFPEFWNILEKINFSIDFV